MPVWVKNLRDIARYGFKGNDFTSEEVDQAIDALCNRTSSEFVILRREKLAET